MFKRIVFLCFVVSTFMLAQTITQLPLSKVEKHYVIDYDKDTKCLVRKFKVYQEPTWACKIELQNGKKVFFSSPKSMFEFYHQPGKWFDVGVKSENDFKDIIVTDYTNLKPINAREAYFIYGSRAISPAGDDLVPFENRDDAANFAKKYNGKRVLTFEQIKPSLIRLLNGRI